MTNFSLIGLYFRPENLFKTVISMEFSSMGLLSVHYVVLEGRKTSKLAAFSNSAFCDGAI